MIGKIFGNITGSMSNFERNRQFANVCQKLKIIDMDLKNRLHRYLSNNQYEDISDGFSFEELIEVAREFLENEGKAA
jgi:hypothetical protein